MEEIPYDYIFFLMFHSLRKFGDRDYVEIADAEEYFNMVLEMAIETAKYALKEDIEFEEPDFAFFIEKFLKDYSGYFYRNEKGDRIYIKDDVKPETLEEETLNSISSEREEKIFGIDFEDYELLKLIKATYVHDEYRRIIALEMLTERAYFDYCVNPTKENLMKIQSKLLYKAGILKSFREIEYYHLDAIYLANVDFMDKNIVKYDESPVDRDLWDEYPHYGDINFGSVFMEIPHYAIFGTGTLAYDKLESSVQDIYESKCKDKEVESLRERYEEYQRIQSKIYMSFLRNLNEYLKTHEPTEELLRVKARLLYYFDNTDICIHTDKGFEAYCSNVIDKITIKPGDLLKLRDEAKFFAGELFYGKDVKHVTQKLLLMKTYYDLSHDEEFLVQFSSFKDLPKYKEYKNAVFGKNMTLDI